jgi:predicted CXXCH cytochrome family protein
MKRCFTLLFTALLMALIGGVLAGSLLYPQSALAESAPPAGHPIAQEAQPVSPVSNLACQQCHVGNQGVMILPSGEEVPVNVDLDVLSGSIHGLHTGSSVGCIDCHNPADYAYPHRPNPAQNLAEFRAGFAEGCQSCHFGPDSHNPGHLLAQLYDLNDNLPTCVDCHGGHDVVAAGVLNAQPVTFCQSCHVSFEDPQVEALHHSVLGNLTGNQSCQTCHTDNLMTIVGPSQALLTAAGAETPFVNPESCVTCHNLLTEDLTLSWGETIPLHVDLDMIQDSVHGAALAQKEGYEPLTCISCHAAEEHAPYPHTIDLPETAREYAIARSTAACQECHVDVFEDRMDDIHGHALNAGNLEAATCVDCHGAHDVQPPDMPRQRISQTCAQCHGEINHIYEQSVHGAAMLTGDPNVPTCTDCHGVHGIADPGSASFRLRSPQVCAECHADEGLMAQYGISTNVFNSYVADFHGSTATLFEVTAEGQAINTALCYDCHGAHNILASSDENSRIIKENLLETCRDCHPTASANFPDAWTSHYEPSLTYYPVVYLVDLFYKLLIPGVVGGFAVFVGFDAYRMVINRRKKRQDHAAEEPDEPADSPDADGVDKADESTGGNA